MTSIITLEIPAQVEYDYHSYIPDRFDCPGQSEGVELREVWVSVLGTRLNVLSLLDQREKDALEDEALENAHGILRDSATERAIEQAASRVKRDLDRALSYL